MNFFNENLVMPGDWIPITQKILKQNNKVIVLGKTDSGKTGFIRSFSQYLIRRNKRVGVIDGDIGQSTLGPPGTVGMCILDNENLKSGTVSVENMVFVGATSPGRYIEKFINSIDQLYKICQKHRIDIILFDTTGLVTGSLGIYLKCSLIKRIEPSALVALQLDKELEPILKDFEKVASIQIYRLKPYQDVKRKNWPERKKQRERQYREYFKKKKLMKFNFSKNSLLKGVYFGNGQLLECKEIENINEKYQVNLVSIEALKDKVILITENQEGMLNPNNVSKIKEYYTVEYIIMIPKNWFEYLLISFNDRQGLSKSLGIIKEINFQQKQLKCYIPGDISLNNFVQIEIGQLKVRPDGTELPYVKPKIY